MNIEEILKISSPLPGKKKLVINLMLSNTHAIGKVADVLKPFDISIQQFNVLRILRGQKGNPASLGCIQDRMIHKMSNTTRLIDKLLEKKLVDRNTCEENRRKIEVFITSKGLQLLEEIDPVIEKIEEDILKNLNDEEVRTLNNLLEKFRG